MGDTPEAMFPMLIYAWVPSLNSLLIPCFYEAQEECQPYQKAEVEPLVNYDQLEVVF